MQTKYNMGNTLLLSGDTSAAWQQFEESIQIAKQMDNAMRIYFNNVALSELEIEEGNLEQAEKRLNEIATFISESAMRKNLQTLFSLRYKLEENRGHFENAFYYLKMYISFKDSLNEIARPEEIDNLQLKFEMEKKTFESQQLRDKTIIQQKTIQNQQLFVVFIFIVMILLGFIIFVMLKAKEKSGLHISNFHA